MAADAQQGRERRGGITSLPDDLLKSILQKVVDSYVIFPPALVCTRWNEAIGSLSLSVNQASTDRDSRRSMEGQDFCDAMSGLGKVESVKLSCSRIQRLAPAMAHPGGARWCLHLKRLKLSDVDGDLCNSAVAGTAFSSVTSASLHARGEGVDSPVWLPEMTSLQRLELSGFNVESLSLPSSIQELHLSAVDAVPDSIGDLPHLRILKLLSVSRIFDLPESLGNLTQLEDLVIKDCLDLEWLPESLHNLSKLRSLRLRGCPNLRTPLDFLSGSHQMHSLQVFKAHNDFRGYTPFWPGAEFPPSLGTCTALRVLHLSSDCMRTLDVPLGALTNLQKLRLDALLLETLPRDLDQLLALRELLLFSDVLTHLPFDLTHPNLTTLALFCPSLRRLPEVWGPSLKHLLVGGMDPRLRAFRPEAMGRRRDGHTGFGCQLEALPAGISSLVNLETLAVGSSRMRSLPVEAASHLTTLTEASFYFWEGSRDSMEGFLGGLPALRSLDFQFVSIGSFPRLLQPLPQLQHLDLGTMKCHFKIREQAGLLRLWQSHHWYMYEESEQREEREAALKGEGELDASSFEGLGSLKELTVQVPYLLKLPHLGSLRNLVKLFIRTGIEELPDSIGALTSLESLHLIDLRITRFPSSICNLTSLTSLNMLGMANLREFTPCATWTRLRELSIIACHRLSLSAPSSWGLPPLEKLTIPRYSESTSVL